MTARMILQISEAVKGMLIDVWCCQMVFVCLCRVVRDGILKI